MKKRGNEHSDKATKPMNNETNERRKEARKQGKKVRINKQMNDQKIQVQKDTKWTHAQGSQWKNERKKKEKQTMV